MKFKVTLQRIGFAEVEIEANSATEARAMLREDDDLSHELYHMAINSWWAPEIKIKAVVKAIPSTVL